MNATIFAYGQTASGKTHTMRGNEASPGLIPLSIAELFQNISTIKERAFEVKVSFIELYNETINDLLLTNNKSLEIRENLKGTYIEGLSEFEVLTPEEAMGYLFQGDAIKKVAETKLNEQSSRSHTVFRLTIHSKPKDKQSQNQAEYLSQLNLVDLAGSEGLSRTKAEGMRLRYFIII